MSKNTLNFDTKFMVFNQFLTQKTTKILCKNRYFCPTFLPVFNPFFTNFQFKDNKKMAKFFAIFLIILFTFTYFSVIVQLLFLHNCNIQGFGQVYVQRCSF